MAIRTIRAPGVEITEIDKSEYTQSMTSTTVLVAGFASKGENYEPTVITSKSSLVNYFGEPKNEAERYFYAACNEVIAQNGRLIACKIPYDNKSTNRFRYAEYKIDGPVVSCSDTDFVGQLYNAMFNPIGSIEINRPGAPSQKPLDNYVITAIRDLTLDTNEKFIEELTNYVIENPDFKIDNATKELILNSDSLTTQFYNVLRALPVTFAGDNPANPYTEGTVTGVLAKNSFISKYVDKQVPSYISANVVDSLNNGSNSIKYAAKIVGDISHRRYATPLEGDDVDTIVLAGTNQVTDNYVEYISANSARSGSTLFGVQNFPNLHKYTVPAGVKYVMPGAFTRNTALTALDFNGAQYIGSNVADRDNSLSTVTMTVNEELSVDFNAFGGSFDSWNSNIVSPKNLTAIIWNGNDDTGRKFTGLDNLSANLSVTVFHKTDSIGNKFVARTTRFFGLENSEFFKNIDTIDCVVDGEGGTRQVDVVVPTWDSRVDTGVKYTAHEKYILACNMLSAEGADQQFKNLHIEDFYAMDTDNDGLITDKDAVTVYGINFDSYKDAISEIRFNSEDNIRSGASNYSRFGSLNGENVVDIIIDLNNANTASGDITGSVVAETLYNELSGQAADIIAEANAIETELSNYHFHKLFAGTRDGGAGNELRNIFEDEYAEFLGELRTRTAKKKSKKSKNTAAVVTRDVRAVPRDQLNEFVDALIVMFENYLRFKRTDSKYDFNEYSILSIPGKIVTLRAISAPADDNPDDPGIKDSTVLEQLAWDVFSQMSFDKMIDIAGEVVNNITSEAAATRKANTIEALASINRDLETRYITKIYNTDKTIDKFLEIKASENIKELSQEVLDLYNTGESLPPKDSFIIVDRLGGQYAKTASGKKECLGIVPIVVTAPNALAVQNLIDLGDNTSEMFEAIGEVIAADDETGARVSFPGNEELTEKLYASGVFNSSVSKRAARCFPAIPFLEGDKFDKEDLKKIGLVITRAYVDSGSANKISFEILESFVGELDRTAVSPVTGVSTFIDNIVNSESEYVYMFSNIDFSSDRGDFDSFTISKQIAKSLGWRASELVKDISIEKLNQGLEIIFSKNEDIHEKAIDVVVDAGISNIAQYIATLYGTGKGQYDPTGTDSSKFVVKSNENKKAWLTTLQKFNEFCLKTRRDCMFIADGLRPLCLRGSKKIVRPSKPTNTIDNAILPNLKYLAGINTNYGAGYMDWFEIADDFTGVSFWCPPSIQAAGCYIYTDINYNYWDAPAGQKRGNITALDVAFSPSIKQAGEIYDRSWNYAINYANIGLILEGQKTLQLKASAFDRVNVRRLFLRLERAAYYIARQFVYEPNTAYTRQCLSDRLNSLLATVKANGGCYDYKIICDETINTPDVIDNNELRVKIGIKPTKTAEFILVQFYALRTGGSWDEMDISFSV